MQKIGHIVARILIERIRIKGRKSSTKEKEMIETTREIHITKIRNIVILLKKKLTMNLNVMKMKLSMLL